MEEVKNVLIGGVFEFPPFTYACNDPVVISNGKSYCGVEVTIMDSVADALGMGLVLQTPSDGKNHWGSIFSNGSSDGLLGDIHKGVVDVGAGEYFNRLDRNEHLDPSDFYNYDYFCFLLSKPPPSPEWMQLMMPFSAIVWIGTCACLVFTILFLVMFRQLTGLIKNVVLQGISFYINQSMSMDQRYSLKYMFNLQHTDCVSNHSKQDKKCKNICDMCLFMWACSFIGIQWQSDFIFDCEQQSSATSPNDRLAAHAWNAMGHNWLL